MEEDRAPPRNALPPAIAAGAMLVAGVLHLLLVEAHFAHARGAGLFFLGLGAAQMVWAFAYLRQPTQRLGRLGLVALVAAPVVLYVLTRIWRAPWSAGPEAIDAIGIATQVIQLAAGGFLLWQWAPALPAGSPAAIGMGILLAVGGYAGAIATEDVDWLAEAEGGHPHAAGNLHAEEVHAHGDDAPHLFGTRGASLVGTVEYYGPETGAKISTECRSIGHDDQGCWLHHLGDLLNAHGAVAAFDALVELLEANPKADNTGHALAHLLGHHAYQAYGLDISLTLGECSYDVFQGCIHGALQSYFDDLGRQGKQIDKGTISDVCSAATTSFEEYACLHGVGHGIMMYSNYALHESLDTCYLLDGSFAQRSCYGGVVMENVVAYKDSLRADHQAHDHGHDEPPEFWVDENDHAYPCNVVKERYQDSCWRMQTSLILHFNGEDFKAASATCDEAGKHKLACYASLGRDAPPRAARDPARMSKMCSYGDWEAQTTCVAAFTAGIILDANSPEAGLGLCAELAEKYKPTCYEKTGNQARSMLLEEDGAALCDRAPEAYVADCHAGRQ